jgi:streptomycin 6-kinase
MWGLSNVGVIPHLSWNYLVSAEQKNTPVIVKISYDKDALFREYKTLIHTSHEKSVSVIDFSYDHGALLLRKSFPGITVQSAKMPFHEKLRICGDILASYPYKKPDADDEHVYEYAQDWISLLQLHNNMPIEKKIYDKAVRLTRTRDCFKHFEYVCHGEIHMENIIKDGQSWITINPKGVIGNPYINVSSCDIVQPYELHKKKHIQSLMHKRIFALAKYTHLSYHLLLESFFIRCLISAQKSIEDNLDPSYRITLARHLYHMITHHQS